jgi:hypothetical protein
MQCPFATQLPVGNHGGAMTGHLGLVLHVQQGTGSLAGYFNNPASQVSAHFWVSQAGALEQYVDTDLQAWAEEAGNVDYLSVETEGFDTAPLTSAQISMLGVLLAWCASTYKFPLTGPVAHGQSGFTPHCNPDGTPDPAWGNHPCPGTIRLGQMGQIITAAGPTKTEGENMTHWQAGGQDHVTGVIGSVAYHWWQNSAGTAPPNAPADYYAWHVEQLPL